MRQDDKDIWQKLDAIAAQVPPEAWNAMQGVDVQALTEALTEGMRAARDGPRLTADERSAIWQKLNAARAALAAPSPAPQALTAAWDKGYEAGFSDMAEPGKTYTIMNPTRNPFAAPAVQPAEPPRGFQWGPEVRGAIADLVDAGKALHSAAPPPTAVPPRFECPECHIPGGCEVGKCSIGALPPAAVPAPPRGRE